MYVCVCVSLCACATIFAARSFCINSDGRDEYGERVSAISASFFYASNHVPDVERRAKLVGHDGKDIVVAGEKNVSPTCRKRAKLFRREVKSSQSKIHSMRKAMIIFNKCEMLFGYEK